MVKNIIDIKWEQLISSWSVYKNIFGFKQYVMTIGTWTWINLTKKLFYFYLFIFYFWNVLNPHDFKKEEKETFGWRQWNASPVGDTAKTLVALSLL